MDKTARKTAVPGRPFAKGADARRGHGKKGRSGRPPDEFKAFLKAMRDDPAARKALLAAARNKECRNFGTAWKIAGDYDESKPAARADLTTKGEKISGVVILPATEGE